MSDAPKSFRYFIPEYRNYYHFLSETALGLYRVLLEHKQLEKKQCEFWYKGAYAPIVQLFSCYPVHVVDHWGEIPDNTLVLPHFRPKIHQHWLALRPLREYFEAMFDPKPETPGITVVKRVHLRSYSEHDALVENLIKFGMPVREVIMENLSFEEQINLMRNTRIFVAPHGAAITNMIFMPQGSLVLELYPKGFYCRVTKALTEVFGHYYADIESEKPSVIGRQPPPRVQEFLDASGWPSRKDFFAWEPDQMEMGRVLRDVSSFSIDPQTVIGQLERMINEPMRLTTGC